MVQGNPVNQGFQPIQSNFTEDDLNNEITSKVAQYDFMCRKDFYLPA